jgi:hypothetical protein
MKEERAAIWAFEPTLMFHVILLPLLFFGFRQMMTQR